MLLFRAPHIPADQEAHPAALIRRKLLLQRKAPDFSVLIFLRAARAESETGLLCRQDHSLSHRRNVGRMHQAVRGNSEKEMMHAGIADHSCLQNIRRLHSRFVCRLPDQTIHGLHNTSPQFSAPLFSMLQHIIRPRNHIGAERVLRIHATGDGQRPSGTSVQKISDNRGRTDIKGHKAKRNAAFPGLPVIPRFHICARKNSRLHRHFSGQSVRQYFLHLFLIHGVDNHAAVNPCLTCQNNSGFLPLYDIYFTFSAFPASAAGSIRLQPCHSLRFQNGRSRIGLDLLVLRAKTDSVLLCHELSPLPQNPVLLSD